MIAGLDIGTMNVIAARRDNEGAIAYRKIRDCFLPIEVSEFLGGDDQVWGEQLLRQSGAHYIKEGNTLYILGDSAYEFAGIMHRELHRPMAAGVLNPKERLHTAMLQTLIKAIAPTPQEENDVIYASCPADPLDGQFDIGYHRGVIRDTLEEMGFSQAKVMNEALAIIYSELEDNQYSGIAVGFGAGMTNMTFAYLGLPIFSFSIPRGGDFVDSAAAEKIDETATAINYLKEQGVNISLPRVQLQNEAERAIAIYYEILLQDVIRGFQEVYQNTPRKQLPNIVKPLPVVVAGGTSLALGFIERLQAMIAQVNFPVPISEIRHSKEPLYAVARGLLRAAEIEAAAQAPQQPQEPPSDPTA